MTEPVYVLSAAKQARPFGRSASPLRTAAEVSTAFRQARRARWIAPDALSLRLLAAVAEPNDTWHRLLVLDALPRSRRELLSALFRVVVAPGEGVRLLPPDDLAAVVGAEHPEDYFIGGVVDLEDKCVVLYRGDLDRLVVPLDWFKSSGRASRPDFSDFEVIDSGQTVRFGSYEAAADAILYEFDRDARKRMKEREIDQDRSLGGSIRRLRLARGLSRADFPGVDAKTVARIERGEVEHPQQQTLAILAGAFGVPVEELGTY